MVRGGGRVGPRAVLGELPRFHDFGRDLRFDVVQLGGRGLASGQQMGAQALNGAAVLPLLDVLARAVGEIPHSLRVCAGSIGLAFHKRRAAAAAGPLDRLAEQSGERHGVIAVDFQSDHAVVRAAGADTAAASRVGVGHLGGELIVFTHENHRQAPDARQIQSFVERSVVGGSVPEKRDGDPVGPQQLEGIAGARRLQDAWPDNAARPHHAHFGLEQVHASAPAMRTAGRASKKFGHQLPGFHPFRQGVAVAAMRAEHDIVKPQMGGDRGGNRLLAHVRMTRSVDQPALVTPCELFLGLSNPRHRAVNVQQHGPPLSSLVSLQVSRVNVFASLVAVRSSWESCRVASASDLERPDATSAAASNPRSVSSVSGQTRQSPGSDCLTSRRRMERFCAKPPEKTSRLQSRSGEIRSASTA